MKLAAGLVAAAFLLAAGVARADMTAMPIARLQGLDKTTARISQFEASVGHEVQFGTLSIWVRACRRSAPEDPPENAAFLEIFETRPGEAKKTQFSGWMFSSSPAISALENPVYDINLLECRAPPAAPAAAAPAPPSAPNSAPRGNTRGKSVR